MPNEQLFYDLLANVYELLFPVTEEQRGFLTELVREHSVRRVLDVACGSGEQAALFRELGLEVDALEYNERMTERVRGKGFNVRFGSMERVVELFAPGYGLVLCIGNSLPHLESRGAVERAVRGMASLLDSGGVLVLSIVNFDCVVREAITSLPPKRVVDDAGRRIAFERFYDLAHLEDRITFSTRLTIEGTTRTASVPLLPIPVKWLEDRVRAAKLRIIGQYGDFARAPFTPDSASLILVATRE
ncbi:MAG: class I SAM-dependent methyltransferase [Verrucomicrobia bacterium]|nr:class I SAM-dependent methyltransferase [Verrucomicrobiota bacterium]